MSFNSEFGQTGKYMEFYKAIKLMHPDIQMISNCDGSSASLDPAFEASAWHRANLEIVILKTIFRQVSSCTLSCLFFSNFASVCALLLLMLWSAGGCRFCSNAKWYQNWGASSGLGCDSLAMRQGAS
jgi:hypothetical protein